MTRSAFVLFATLAFTASAFAAGKPAATKLTQTRVRPAQAFSPSDCAQVTKFKKPYPRFGNTSACRTALFWNNTSMLNPPRDSRFNTLRVCLGFGTQAIDPYLQTFRDRGKLFPCRRLASTKWTERLNQLFIWCIAKGQLGGKPLWLTRSRNVDKSYPRWTTMVTTAEMCYWNHLTGQWPK